MDVVAGSVRLGALCRALTTRGVVRVLQFESVSRAAVARALHIGTKASGMFVQLDAAFADPVSTRDAVMQSRRGTLYLSGTWPPEDLRRLEQEARAAGTGLVLDGPGVESLEPGVNARVATLDACFAVATEPALHALRQGLLAYCRGAGTVLLQGPPGAGKRSLARLIHAMHDDRPLAVVRSGDDRAPAPGCWQLYEEVPSLAAGQLDPLRRRLATHGEPPPLVVESTPRPAHPAFDAIEGESPLLCTVLASAWRAATRGQFHLLLQGETGTGKDVLARAIHAASGRTGRFVALDLASRADSLAEDDLFGHDRGAFTGGDRARSGAFRDAEGGTLFLDEVGNLPVPLQARLLRVLENREVQPLGADRPVPVNVRVVAATHVDLEAACRRGEFRFDLYQRLAGRVLTLPPLRHRDGDIAPLARRFAAEAARANGLGAPTFTPAALAALESAPWPGNVRELRNVVESAVAEAEGDLIDVDNLGPLAPANRRPVPAILTASDAEPIGDPAFVQSMTAVTMRLPGLRDGRSGGIERAILAGLGGRPVRPDALAALAARPWWGNYAELERTLVAIRASVPGVVDTAALAATLPHLLQPDPAAPILVLLHPTVQPDGEVVGQVQSFPQAAVVVGRHPGALAQLGHGDCDARLKPRMARIEALTPDGEPGYLSLSLFRKLGRVHLLLRRARDARGQPALEVHLLAESGPTVRAGPLAQADQELWSSEPRNLGAAGEISVWTADGLYLQFYVFLGRVALAEAAVRLAARIPPPLPTGAVDLQPARAPEDPAGRRTRWRLDVGEQGELNRAVVAWLDSGEDFTVFLRRMRAVWADNPALGRLAAYFDGPEASKYGGRLYAHPQNGELRASLVEALGERVDRLPAPILAAVTAGDIE